jgi:hypothetical protein
MINPFNDNNDVESARDTDQFIIHTQLNNRRKNTKSVFMYVLIALIYGYEIFTTILGGLNESTTIGFNNSGLTIQYWLMIAGIYNMCGLIAIYQFNLRKYENKFSLLCYKFIKFVWLSIGLIILFGYNDIKEYHFILGYALFYIIFEIIWMCNNFIKIIILKKNDNHNIY